MKTIIVYAHPYEGSFNHAVLEEVCHVLEQKESPYQVIDLYADRFDPRYTKEELQLFSHGASTDPQVVHYQKLLETCSELVFICPLWWNDLPGMLKGFIDKVLKKNFAYEDSTAGVKGKLVHIKKASIITTSSSPTWYLRFVAGNAIQSVVLNATLKQIGIKKRRWINFGSIGKRTTQERDAFLATISRAL